MWKKICGTRNLSSSDGPVNCLFEPFRNVKTTSLLTAPLISPGGRLRRKSIAVAIRALSSGISGSVSEKRGGATPASKPQEGNASLRATPTRLVRVYILVVGHPVSTKAG